MAKKWQKFDSILSSPREFEKGHFVVYTADHRRFIVPLAYLNDSVMRELLRMSEEEYGLPSDGPIVLPCDSIFMDYVISLISQGRTSDLHKALIESVALTRYSSCYTCEGQMKHQFLVY
ncbi:hypothetical protein ACJIZ3_015245 [Penstemon smallii]|uniref:Uncharacterized protein n=1 Tax=Penstemon smallii TaxID=265156 RepID=A0ABD3RLY4_9LAMI